MIISEWNQTEKEKSYILNLAMKTFGETELSNSSYFDWQYLHNPQGKAVVVTVKDENANDAIVGVNAFLPMTLMVNQSQITCLLSCNSIVDPNYRKKGIFTQLVSNIPEIFAQKKISFIYGIPNSNSSKIFTKNNFLEIGKLPLLVKPLKLSSYFGQPLSTIMKPFDIFWKPNKQIKSNVKLLDKKFESEFDDLITKSSHRLPIFHFRNKDYLQWRYMNHPTRRYHVFTLRSNSNLIGYVITREMEIHKKRVGVIVDFLIDAEFKQKDVFLDLIYTALKSFWENGVSIAITTSKTGLIENEILRSSGFFTAPSILKQEQLSFIISILDNNLISPQLKIFDNWFITLGDYDVF
jgi:hypothetical protein